MKCYVACQSSQQKVRAAVVEIKTKHERADGV